MSHPIIFLWKLDLTRTEPQDSKEKWKIYAKKFANKIEVESPADKWAKYVQKVVDKEAKNKEDNNEKFDSLNDKYQQEVEKEEIERKRKELEDDSEDSDDLGSDEYASSDEERETIEDGSKSNIFEDKQDCHTENEQNRELKNEQSDVTTISNEISKNTSNLAKQSEKQNLEVFVADVNYEDEVTLDAEEILTEKKVEGQGEIIENTNKEAEKSGDQALADNSNADGKPIDNRVEGKSKAPTPEADTESCIDENNEKGQNGERNEDDDSNKESHQNNEQGERNNTLDNLAVAVNSIVDKKSINNSDEGKSKEPTPEADIESCTDANNEIGQSGEGNEDVDSNKESHQNNEQCEVNNNILDNLQNPEEIKTINDSNLLERTKKFETMEDLEDAILEEVALMKKGVTIRSIEVDNLIQQLNFDITWYFKETDKSRVYRIGLINASRPCNLRSQNSSYKSFINKLSRCTEAYLEPRRTSLMGIFLQK